MGAGGLFGLGVGGVMPMWGALVGAAFGRRTFAKAMGLMGPFMVPIQATGAPLAGLLYDRTGSYHVAFMACLGVYVAAMAALLLLKLPKEEPGPVDSAPLEPGPSIAGGVAGDREGTG